MPSCRCSEVSSLLRHLWWSHFLLSSFCQVHICDRWSVLQSSHILHVLLQELPAPERPEQVTLKMIHVVLTLLSGGGGQSHQGTWLQCRGTETPWDTAAVPEDRNTRAAVPGGRATRGHGCSAGGTETPGDRAARRQNCQELLG